MQRRLLPIAMMAALCCTLGTAQANAAVDQPGCAPSANSPSRLTDEQRYIDWVASATPEELVATFGRGTP
jgi:hypothetical protein